MLRIPDEALDCVMFLATQDGERLHYGGTAFIAPMPGPDEKYFPYLVTAKHNIEMAKRNPGRLVARFNVKGGSELLDLSQSEVITPEDEGIDLAIFGDVDWSKVLDGRMR